MPLIDVTYDGTVPELALRHLAELLPSIVAEAVACQEEPWTGPLAAGDIEIRFRPKGPLDVGELNCVVEVRTKLYASRVRNEDERAEMIKTRLAQSERGLGQLGVWLILAEGSWSQH